MMNHDAIAPSASALERSDRRIGLGGVDLPLARSGRRAISDSLFWARLAPFRAEPQSPIEIGHGAAPGYLGVLETLYAQYWRGELPGAPAPLTGGLAGLVTWRQLAPLLPTYRLPACDAVSATDVLHLLNHLSTSRPDDASGSLDWRVFGRAPELGPRRAAVATPPCLEELAVSQCVVEEFAGQFPELRDALVAAIPWMRVGSAAFAYDWTANAIASDFLGIPIDLRCGALVREEDVASATCLAAGWGDAGERARLQTIVSQTVPKVRKRAGCPGLPNGIYRGTRGAAWSVALDAALNSPAVWARDAAGSLPRIRRTGSAARRALAELPSTYWVPAARTGMSRARLAAMSRV
jgi:hypothetical protein